LSLWVTNSLEDVDETSFQDHFSNTFLSSCFLSVSHPSVTHPLFLGYNSPLPILVQSYAQK